MPRFAFGLQLPLHHDLRGDSGVIRTDHPIGVVTLHTVIANQRIHQRLLKRVAHVQRAGHVGRRQLNGVRGLRSVTIRNEISGLLPDRIPLALDVFWFEGF